MGSRLDRITDWDERARKAGYRATVFARHAGVTRQQLDRYFRVRWGVAPHFWLERVLIDDSLLMLQQGKLIKEIAHALGYRNATSFSKAFRRVQGACPTSILNELLMLRVVPNDQNVPNSSQMFQIVPSSSLSERRVEEEPLPMIKERSKRNHV